MLFAPGSGEGPIRIGVGLLIYAGAKPKMMPEKEMLIEEKEH